MVTESVYRSLWQKCSRRTLQRKNAYLLNVIVCSRIPAEVLLKFVFQQYSATANRGACDTLAFAGSRDNAFHLAQKSVDYNVRGIIQERVY